MLSAAQMTSLRQATAIESELERLEALLSRGEEVDLKASLKLLATCAECGKRSELDVLLKPSTT